MVLERWQAGQEISLDSQKGMEILVLDGSIEECEEKFIHGSWLRLPVDSIYTARAGKDGARVWIKRDHLNETHLLPQV